MWTLWLHQVVSGYGTELCWRLWLELYRSRYPSTETFLVVVEISVTYHISNVCTCRSTWGSFTMSITCSSWCNTENPTRYFIHNLVLRLPHSHTHTYTHATPLVATPSRLSLFFVLSYFYVRALSSSKFVRISQTSEVKVWIIVKKLRCIIR